MTLINRMFDVLRLAVASFPGCRCPCICSGVCKCPYCDFNSHELRGDLPQVDYVDALIADVEHAAVGLGRQRVHSVCSSRRHSSLFSPDKSTAY